MYGITELSIGESNYSKKFWENLLHLLENSANTYPPLLKTEGSLWYDSENRQLKVSTETEYGMLEWKTLKGEEIDYSLYIDQYKFNEISKLTLIDADAGDTLYEGEGKNDDHAVTKKYADEYHGNIKEISGDGFHGFKYPNSFVILYGTKIGDIILPYEMDGINYSVVGTNFDSFNYGKVINKTSKSFNINCNSWVLCGYSK